LEKIISITENCLLDLLRSESVPVEKYGKGASNSVKRMSECINKGEFFLGFKNGVLTRFVNVVCLAVYTCCGQFILREKYQIKHGNNDTKSIRFLYFSLGETVPTYETIPLAACRAMLEELPQNIWTGAPLFPIQEESWEREGESKNYPGINNVYSFHKFTTSLTQGISLVETSIYEEECNITTGFDWVWVSKMKQFFKPVPKN